MQTWASGRAKERAQESNKNRECAPFPVLQCKGIGHFWLDVGNGILTNGYRQSNGVVSLVDRSM